MSYQEDLEKALNLVVAEMAENAATATDLNEDSIEDRLKFQEAMDVVQNAISNGVISSDEISKRLSQN